MQTTTAVTTTRENVPSFKLRRRPLLPSASYLRLERTLPLVFQEHEYLVTLRGARQNAAAPYGDWVGQSQALIDSAVQALTKNSSELGWRCLKEAGRYHIYGMAECSPEMLQARAAVLYDEAVAKLDGWRKTSLVDLLTKDGKFNPIASPENVVRAAQILDEYYNNVFEKLALYERRLGLLSGASVIGLFLWVLVAGWVGFPTTLQPDMNRWFFWGLILIIGVLGAILSMFTTMVSGPDKSHLPESLSNLSVTSARLIIAPLTATLAVILLLTKIINLGDLKLETMILAAIAAGFSEKLVVRPLQSLLNTVENPPDSSTNPPSAGSAQASLPSSIQSVQSEAQAGQGGSASQSPAEPVPGQPVIPGAVDHGTAAGQGAQPAAPAGADSTAPGPSGGVG